MGILSFILSLGFFINPLLECLTIYTNIIGGWIVILPIAIVITLLTVGLFWKEKQNVVYSKTLFNSSLFLNYVGFVGLLISFFFIQLDSNWVLANFISFVTVAVITGFPMFHELHHRTKGKMFGIKVSYFGNLGFASIGGQSAIVNHGHHHAGVGNELDFADPHDNERFVTYLFRSFWSQELGARTKSTKKNIRLINKIDSLLGLIHVVLLLIAPYHELLFLLSCLAIRVPIEWFNYLSHFNVTHPIGWQSNNQIEAFILYCAGHHYAHTQNALTSGDELTLRTGYTARFGYLISMLIALVNPKYFFAIMNQDMVRN